MAGDFVDESTMKFDKPIQKHFNSYTLRGRRNWVLATYGTIFGIVLFRKMTKKTPKPEDKQC